MIYNTVVSDIAGYLEQLGNPWKNVQSLNVLLPNLINLVLITAVVVFFFLLLLGGIQWITAGGDKESLAKAQGKITSALIGIVIVLSAWAILNLVRNFFGLGRTGGPPGQTCLYCENCEGSRLKTHQCHGTIQGGTCKYDPGVNPSCSPCRLCGDGTCSVCEGSDWCPQDCRH